MERKKLKRSNIFKKESEEDLKDHLRTIEETAKDVRELLSEEDTE